MSMLSTSEENVIYSLAEKLIGVSQQGRFRKEILVRNVERRMEVCGLKTIREYLQFANKRQSEYKELLSALTIHTTSWFRERPHFDLLEDHAMKFIKEKVDGVFKVASMACSTGEEVYSIGMLLESIRMKYPQFEYAIYGGDIDSVSLSKAKRGVYSNKGIDDIPKRFQMFIRRGTGQASQFFKVNREVMSRCRFGVEDLTRIQSTASEFNYIFCRNALIYFTPKKVEVIIKSLVSKLSSKGVLTIGHCEVMGAPKTLGLESVGASSYRRICDRVVATPVVVAKKKTRVLIVDDSQTIRTVLTNKFKSSGFNVLVACDANEASEILKDNIVDAITLDLNMPGMNGHDWLKQIRKDGVKTPVIIVTETRPENGKSVLEILEQGAQAYVPKQEMASEENSLVDMIKEFTKTSILDDAKVERNSSVKKKDFTPEMILIGASTGGTQALVELLEDMDKTSPPIVVIQHIAPAFSGSFARRLSEASGLVLADTTESAELKNGHIYLATDDYHLGIKQRGSRFYCQRVTEDIPGRHRPSVDCLFRSATPHADKVAAMMLTGMGSDGAHAMLSLYKGGAQTYAQDSTSSVVFGMPKAAINCGAVSTIGNIQELRKELDKIIR